MSKEKFKGVFYGSDFFQEEEEKAVVEVIRSQSLFRYYGKKLLYKADKFEEDLRKYFNKKYALVVSSGTAAIKCALKAINIQKGDEVIVPAYGFIATAGAVSNVGAVPIFADIDSTMNIDLTDIKRKITKNTKAIIVVHLFGASANIEEIVDYAYSKNIKVIEDVAQAFGGKFGEKKLGTFGDIGCYSFQANKIVCTGEGGAIVTDNENYYIKARMYHDQGGLRIGDAFPRWDDPRCFLGENLRMSELHAAIGIEQLKKLPMMLETLKRRKNILKERLHKYNLSYRKILSEGECNTTLIFFVDDNLTRKQLKKEFEQNRISINTYYGSSVYECGIFGDSMNCTYSDKIAPKVFGLPIIMKMSDCNFEKYVEKIENSFENILSVKNKMIKKMFKKNIIDIKEINDLDYKVDYLPNLFVFKNNYIKTQYNKNSVVVGGPCIDRCEADINNLGINFYLDVLMPMNYALVNNLDCVIYLDTPIEEYKMDSNIDVLNRWIKTADIIEKFILDLGKHLKVQHVQVIRREKVYKELDKLIKKFPLEDNKLQNLYNLVPSQSYNSEAQLILHYKRVIMAYQPCYISNLLEKEIDRVIVIEGLSQCKAVYQAKLLNKDIIPQFYIDMPSISGNNRMHRSSNGIIKVFENIRDIKRSESFIWYSNQINLPAIYKSLEVNNFIDLVEELKGYWENE